MKVLHVGKYYPPHFGGMEIHLQQLISRQAKRFDVEALVAGESWRSSVEELDGAKVRRIGRIGSIASMPLTPLLPWYLRNTTADLIHLHMPNPGAAWALIASKNPARIVVTHHADTLGRQYLRKLSDPFVKQIMRRAEAIIVGSRRYLESSEELAPFAAKCVLIPMGIRSEFFQQPDPDLVATIKRQYGSRIVLAVGRFVPYKGFEYLIKAMKDVRGKLLLIGAGPLEQALAHLVQEAGVGEKIEILPRVGDRAIVSYYHAASVFVMPSISRAEAFGLVQIEAMASGVPVVNTEIASAVPEVSVDGQTGFTVPPMDSKALSAAINLLLDDDDLRLRLGMAARKAAEENYTFDGVADRTMELYRNILGSFRTPKSDATIDGNYSPGPLGP